MFVFALVFLFNYVISEFCSWIYAELYCSRVLKFECSCTDLDFTFMGFASFHHILCVGGDIDFIWWLVFFADGALMVLFVTLILFGG
ncbi:hypothetical protein L1987_59468 [Smallanthus sonchifolius]|uniref:Uncharacterized protein n=1 Tax=Smallanthus sonchifolius TaxID=185202 RepID=A0ACB9D620_9ASTR|nr:hypothetical protein L1987_59468 [Smallanthus sonchifolius]